MEVVLPGYPGELGPGDHGDWRAHDITDTAETRAALEQMAIPACKTWREANPEHISCFGQAGCELAPAPYCCSAYCPRCAGLRALDGVPPIRPNDWMYES